jgi:hypothetical protein
MAGTRNMPTPETLRCRACAEPFAWDGRSSRRPHYCTDATCRHRRTNARAYAYFLRTRSKGCGTQDRPGSVPRPLAGPLEARTAPEPSRESTAHVEALLRAAARSRWLEERRTGKRRFTIEDGWAQKPGTSTVGNPGSDGQGWGWS